MTYRVGITYFSHVDGKCFWILTVGSLLPRVVLLLKARPLAVAAFWRPCAAPGARSASATSTGARPGASTTRETCFASGLKPLKGKLDK